LNDKDKIMKQLILSWGMPDIINKENIVFKFDNKELLNTGETGYHCRDGDVKFCLYDIINKSALFSMEFFISRPFEAGTYKRDYRVNLNLLYLHEDSHRKKGIASYYIERLISYAVQEKIECIVVNPNANALNFKYDIKENSLEQEELKRFYKKRSTKEMPVIFVTEG